MGMDPFAMMQMMYGQAAQQSTQGGQAGAQGPQDMWGGGNMYNIPQGPSQQTVQAFNQQKADHRTEQRNSLTQLEADIERKKDLVFAGKHYEWDANGKPKLGEDGKPILADGEERPAERGLRKEWEKFEKQQIAAKQEQEKAAFYTRAQTQAQKYVQNPFAGGGMDVNNKEKMAEAYKQLEAEEKAMQRRHSGELSQVGTAGLPDKENPGTSLTQSTNDGWTRYDGMVAGHQRAQDNSPEGRTISDYGKAMQDYQNNLLRQMGMYQPPQQQQQEPEEEIPDEGAMRRLNNNRGTWV
jgi:hypothetical protein